MRVTFSSISGSSFRMWSATFCRRRKAWHHCQISSLEMLLFGEQSQSELNSVVWLDAQSKAQAMRNTFPDYNSYLQRYLPANNNPQPIRAHMLGTGQSYPGYMVPPALGNDSMFPGKKTMNFRYVFVARNCDRIYSSLRKLEERNNIIWILPIKCVETPFQQLAFGFSPIAVAFAELLQCRAMEIRSRIMSLAEVLFGSQVDACVCV